jgi:hypothetical protein
MRMRVTPVSRIAGQDGALDRRRAPPARQQRGMDVHTAPHRNIQHRLWQHQAIGDHDHQVRPQGGECLLLGAALSVWRLLHGQAVGEGQRLDRAGAQLAAAPGRPVRLGIDRDHLVRAVEQGRSTGTANSGVPAKTMFITACSGWRTNAWGGGAWINGPKTRCPGGDR